jgi:glycosyltransferase involved in cell wall biosynthesis
MSARLRVAFVHDAYSEYRRPLFRLLAERFDIRFFFLNEQPGSLPAGSETLRAWRIPEMSDYLVAPGLAGRIAAAHKIAPLDLVFLPEPSNFSAHAAWWMARRLRLPYVVWSGEWYTARHPRRWLMRPLERAIVHGASVCLAYGSRARLRFLSLGADPARILLTGNASDYRFTPALAAQTGQARRDWGIGSRPVVLFLGRLVSSKAPDLLVAAFAQLRNEESFLLIAGDGPMRDAIRKQIAQLSLGNVLCTGREVRGAREKDLLYSLASVFVLPSRKGRIAEPWGLVLNEAASAALPIVTARSVGAVGDLIRDGENGMVVKEGDPNALAEAIAFCLQTTRAARAYGKRARVASAEFTIERMADAFGRAFERAAGDR